MIEILSEKTILLDKAIALDILGAQGANIQVIRQYFPEVELVDRDYTLKILGAERLVNQVFEILQSCILYHKKFNSLNVSDVERLVHNQDTESLLAHKNDVLVFTHQGVKIKPITPNQCKLVDSVSKNDMVFAVGAAGTGKTYLAVALAVRALKEKQVKRIILTRPAVEAGENLGFLPGDLKEKLDPYLQPLYDGLRDMIAPDKLQHYLDVGTIQIAPLAFMRGRTLDKAFVILDEAQNATDKQMKMFLTRMGQEAQFIITGDPSQIDLPKNQKSGLVEAMQVLKNIKGIDFVLFDEKDVVRHPLVKKIINAYENNTAV
jgi:phosphate starvation-inducible protein PhoH and related proteins